MSSYNLFAISHDEFEELCDDIVGVKYSVDVKRGKPGPDGGRDGLFIFEDSKRGVVQAKHYGAGAFKSLFSKLKNEELAKAKRLNADQYVLMTSCDLTPDNREAILELFDGVIKSPNDFYDGADIRAELAKPEYTWVVRRHFKLWLSGMDQLERFCGDGIYSKSLSVLEDIKEDLPATVRTSAVDFALSKLMADHVLIITGQAGTGKTTLANQLVADLVFQCGYKLIVAGSDLSVVERQLDRQPEARMVFLLDDLFGVNALDEKAVDACAGILGLIRRVRRAGTCFLVVTSRSYIIKEAKLQYESLKDSKITGFEFELRDGDLSRIDRAKILLAKLENGDVSKDYKARVCEDENYFKIIDHRNFNPRIISHCFLAARVQEAGYAAPSAMAYIGNMLEHPEQIWKVCFREMNVLEVHLVMAVYLSQECPESDLVDLFRHLLQLDGFAKFRGSSFGLVAKKLSCSVLTRIVVLSQDGPPNVKYALFDPSVGDYIIGAYAENDRLFCDVALLLGDAGIVRQIGCNGSWMEESHPEYAAMCKRAYDGIVRALAEDPLRYPPGFVVSVFNGIAEYRLADRGLKPALASSILREGTLFADGATPDEIADCLEWIREHREELLRHPKLTKVFLDGVCVNLKSWLKRVALKGVYAVLELPLPDEYYQHIRKNSDELVSEIISDEIWGDNDTADDFYVKVCDRLRDLFNTYEIPSDQLSIEDCVQDYDFSYLVDTSEEGSRIEPSQTRQYHKDDEDAIIRHMFKGVAET